MRLHHVVHASPSETCASLRAACERRGVAYVEEDPRVADPFRAPLPPGALLYRSGSSPAAYDLEARLHQRGVVSFHWDPEGPLRPHPPPDLAFARAGLPVPRSARLHTTDRATLRAVAELLGGPPLVVRAPGGEGGVGVMLASDLAGLFALCDYLVGQGISPLVSAFVADALHWRVIVIGDRAVTAYTNPCPPDDFRSKPSGAPEDYGLTPPDELAALAVAAARALGVAFAGVDLLVHASGRVYLLEANFPCYFPAAEAFGKADVAGAMLEWLLSRA